MGFAKRVAARLPPAWQAELRRLKFARDIRHGRFVTDEPEFALLDQFISPGDWVVDVGANVGHYTKRLSDLAGPAGRVLAFEPVPETFAILASNVRRFAHSNVSLFNCALSGRMATLSMTLPQAADGLTNYYRAHVSEGHGQGVSILAMPLDGMLAGAKVSLIKVDAEGHELAVMEGLSGLVDKCRPTLIVETDKAELVDRLSNMGYRATQLPGSPNWLFRAAA